ncbi:MAG: hypothetical protein JNL33_04575, partial [Betaproteobacteria bacterium]|nr:hypothetical protein [Betaproteobacteria bacterium]
IGVKEALDVLVTTRAGTQSVNGTATLFDAMVASGTPLYLYRFEAVNEPSSKPQGET